MKSVAIIGAGITGLTAAYYLKRAGMVVTVYEASGRAGGVIRSVRRDGYLAECGPNSPRNFARLRTSFAICNRSA
jgi:oxygen-dependent protoporphyrinogen oxidase